MSRVDNNRVQANNVSQQNNEAQVKQKSTEDNAFAKRLENKPAEQKQETQTPSKPTTKPTEQQDSTGMLQRQGAVFGKGKSLEDLQAQLDAAKGGGKGKGATGEGMDLGDSLDGGMAGTGLGKDSLGKDGLTAKGAGKDAMDLNSKAEDNLLSGDMGSGLGNNIQQANRVTGASQVIEVKGATIPNAMLDKIVDQARVGVNGAGAPEFQFDLKGDVLGGLKMKISMDNGQLKASFLAENADVRRFIDGNLENLRKSLEDKGINVKELEIRDPNDKQREQQNQRNNQQREEAWG